MLLVRQGQPDQPQQLQVHQVQQVLLDLLVPPDLRVRLVRQVVMEQMGQTRQLLVLLDPQVLLGQQVLLE